MKKRKVSKCCKSTTIPEKQYTFWNKEHDYCIECQKHCEIVDEEQKRDWLQTLIITLMFWLLIYITFIILG